MVRLELYRSGLTLNRFFSLLQEAQANSHISLATATGFIKLALIEINQDEILMDYTTVGAVNGQRQYALPASFIREHAIFYKGNLLQRVAPMFMNFSTNSGSFPQRYTVIPYPQDATNSQLSANLGQPVLLVDPPPSDTASGASPQFPTSSDPWFQVWYYPRIPTGFTSSTLAATVFNLPDEMFLLIADRAAIDSGIIDGNDKYVAMLEKRVEGRVKKLQEFREWSANNRPSQILIHDDYDGLYPFVSGWW